MIECANVNALVLIYYSLMPATDTNTVNGPHHGVRHRTEDTSRSARPRPARPPYWPARHACSQCIEAKQREMGLDMGACMIREGEGGGTRSHWIHTVHRRHSDCPVSTCLAALIVLLIIIRSVLSVCVCVWINRPHPGWIDSLSIGCHILVFYIPKSCLISRTNFSYR